MALKGKSTWVLVLFILAGIVLGGFLGICWLRIRFGPGCPMGRLSELRP